MLGPGWAVLAGALASGGFRFEAEVLFKVGLLWLLADPILGTVWHLLTDCGLWRQLTQTRPPEAKPLRPLFPYVAKDSAGYRLLVFTAHLRALENGQGYTLLIALFLAVLLTIILGQPVVLFTLTSILVAFGLGDRVQGRGLLQSLATFLFPYLTALRVMDALSPEALVLGWVYWVVQLGLLRLLAGKMGGGWLVIGGQGVAAGLLFGLKMPLAATVLTLSTLFSLLLRLQAKAQNTRPELYAVHLKPYLLVGLFVVAVSLGAR